MTKTMTKIRTLNKKVICRIAAAFVFSTTVGIGLSAPAQAHFIWLETPAVTELGEHAELKIYFGEYHEGQREIKGGRLDALADTTLSLSDPTGKKVKIKLTEKHNHFSAGMDATVPGIYYLLATDTEVPVQDLTKYGSGVVKPFYYARRSFLSFAEDAVSSRQIQDNAPSPDMTLDIIPLTRYLDVRKGVYGAATDDEVVFQVFFDGQPLAERAQVLVYSPTGWMWEGRLDGQGIGRFTPPWPGLYVVDVTYLKQSPGEFRNTHYEAERHRATLAVPVRANAAP